MKKKSTKFVIFNFAIIQIFLLISMSFAFAFIFQKNTVSAKNWFPSVATNPTGPAFSIGTPNSVIKNIPAGATKMTYTGTETFYENGVAFKGDIHKYNDQWFKVPAGSKEAIPVTNQADIDILKANFKNPNQKEFNMLGIHLQGGSAYLAQGVMFSLFAVGAIQMIGGLAGLDKGMTNALSYSAVGGIMAGKIVGSLGPKGFNVLGNGGFAKAISSPWGQFGVGVLVAAAIFIATYKEEKTKLIDFQCLPYEPPLGGADCELCNADPTKPCSEYRCKSLGQACELVNTESDNPLDKQCVWVSRNDVSSATITPWTDVLSPSGLRYEKDTSVRPPALGVKIKSSKECLPAFTPLEFGIQTNEPARCKIDYNHTNSFDEMKYYFGDTNYLLYNHSQKMRLPSPDSFESDISPELKNDGTFSLFVRCQDANGNVNEDEYSVSFCVDQGPDTTPPIIEEFSIPSGSYIQYNQDKIGIEAYLNEPAECKWSFQNKNYEDMENEMSCLTKSYQINANLLYPCYANLTGIKSREDNTFYFRCKDQPGKDENVRIVNVQSTEYILKGSQPLTISDISPNGTLFGSTSDVSIDLNIETRNGAEEGRAFCYFSPSGLSGSYIAMFDTDNYIHNQTLSLTEGEYTYYIRCVDAGGNVAENFTTFSVLVDKDTPQITRIYKQDGLKIITNEAAECKYSLNDCDFAFEDGLEMIYNPASVKNIHFAEWKPGQTYYIKCSDGYGNLPNPDKCNVEINAIQLDKEEAI